MKWNIELGTWTDHFEWHKEWKIEMRFGTWMWGPCVGQDYSWSGKSYATFWVHSYLLLSLILFYSWEWELGEGGAKLAAVLVYPCFDTLRTPIRLYNIMHQLLLIMLLLLWFLVFTVLAFNSNNENWSLIMLLLWLCSSAMFSSSCCLLCWCICSVNMAVLWIQPSMWSGSCWWWWEWVLLTFMLHWASLVSC